MFYVEHLVVDLSLVFYVEWGIELSVQDKIGNAIFFLFFGFGYSFLFTRFSYGLYSNFSDAFTCILAAIGCYFVFIHCIRIMEHMDSFRLTIKAVYTNWRFPVFLTTILSSSAYVIITEFDIIFHTFFPYPEIVKDEFAFFTNQNIFTILYIVIIAPIAEELVFRRFILKGFLDSQLPKWLALILSSFLFGYMHGNEFQMFTSFFGGLLIGWLYIETGSLFTCMYAHMINNLIAETSLFLGIPFLNLEPNGHLSIRVIVIAIFLMIFGLKGLQRNTGDRTVEVCS